MNGCVCSETTQMLSYILSNIVCPYMLVSLTNRKGSELINRPKYFCVKDVSQTKLTHSLLPIAEGK